MGASHGRETHQPQPMLSNHRAMLSNVEQPPSNVEQPPSNVEQSPGNVEQPPALGRTGRGEGQTLPGRGTEIIAPYYGKQFWIYQRYLQFLLLCSRHRCHRIYGAWAFCGWMHTSVSKVKQTNNSSLEVPANLGPTGITNKSSLLSMANMAWTRPSKNNKKFCRVCIIFVCQNEIQY